MKKFDKRRSIFFLISALGCILIMAACNSSRTVQEAENETIDEAFKQDFERTKDISTGTVPRERLLAAIDRENDIFASRTRGNYANRAVPGISWQERGPNNVGGRIRAVLVDKNDPTNKKVFVGGVGGGIWYTNDITAANPVWNKVNDFLDNMAVTDIIQDPAVPSTIYASTGEGFFNSDAQKGLGIFKSTDGGASFTILGSTSNFEFVQDLEFDNNGKLYASVRSSDAAVSGIVRSSDGGATWAQVLTSPTATSNRGCDIKVSKNGDLYASLGIFDNGGIYKSPAGANVGNAGTWTNITPNPTTGVVEAPNNQWQRIKLAVSPSDNNVLYAVMQGGSSGPAISQNACRGIQQYNAATNTWAVRTIPKIIDQQSNPANYPVFTRDGNSGQAFYDLTAAVDPNNPAALVVSGVDACRSTDNGATWNQISVWVTGGNEQAAGFTTNQQVHADQHNFVFVGGSSAIALLASDGGLYYTTDVNTVTNKPVYFTKNAGLNITQLYATAIHPTAGNNYFLDGCQDNGSHKYTAAGLNNVTSVSGGDGGFCHISPTNPNNQISSYTNNNYYISTDGGATFPSAVVSNGRGSFINPTDYDGNNFYGADDAGAFFRWTNPQANATTGSQVTVANFSGATVTHVSISKLTANRVYFGMDDGSVVRVNNANTANIGVITATPRSGSVSCIASTAANEDSMLVSYSNYGGSKIFVSANGTAGGATFADITGNLPDMPVRWIMFDPRSSKMAIAATELGVWSCDDITVAIPQWSITSSGLARVRVDMLKYRSSDRTLLAATHGRGLFSTKIPDNLNPEVNFSTGSLITAESKSLTTNTCVNYTDYPAAIIINGAPSGADATVTIGIAGGTATEGKDFDILVNGVMSKTVTIADGTTDSKPFTIRVYDDAIAEGSETINLNFTTSGGGSSIGTSNATLAVTITDNDNTIATPTVPVTSTMGDASGSISSYYSPFWGNGGSDAKFQTVILASELTAAGLTKGSNITELALTVTAKNSTNPFNNFNIKLGLTTQAPTASSGFLSATGLTTCYSNAAYNTTMGNNVFVFSVPFVWDGSSNIITQYCYDNTVDFGNVDEVSSKPAVLGAGLRTTVVAQSTAAANLSGCTTTPTASFFPSDDRPITTFKHYKPGTGIETVAGNTKVEFVPTATAAYDFYSSNNKVLAKVTNPIQDLGCVTASLLNDGNGVITPFFSGLRSNKAWSITPTTNGSTAAYTVTLYMTTAELAGADPSTFKIYKSSAATIAGANAGNTVTAATSVLANAEFTSFTASFTGFSTFFIGNNAVILPIHYSDFSGVRTNNSNNLSWKSVGAGISKFDLERSLDGVSFSNAGTVKYTGTAGNYNFTDNIVYYGRAYYRLKIYSPNGDYSYSYIVSLSADKNEQIRVYPSPAKSDVVVSINDNVLLNTIMSIVDNKGSVVKKVLLKGLQQQVELNELPAGVYYFRFTNNTVISVIKQ
ncbi:MAG: T9SS type A sorting domain-containing protein [Chitinophagaceae bacterium]